MRFKICLLTCSIAAALTLLIPSRTSAQAQGVREDNTAWPRKILSVN